MPKLTADDDMDTHNLGGSRFGFSAAKIDKLTGASTYTIVALGGDRSGSTRGFESEIEGTFKSVIESCRSSPCADNLLVRACSFNDVMKEIHGFKLLTDLKTDDYSGQFGAAGGTALYDTTENLVRSVTSYGKTLIKNKYTVNGLVAIITDGCDYGSTLGAADAKKAFDEAMKSENLESLLSILIGINVTEPHVSLKLKEFKDEAGFSQYVEAKDATPKTLAKIANFIAQSVSSQSQMVGSGGPSKPINLTV